MHAHFVPLEIEALAVSGADRIFADIERDATAKLQEIVSALESEGLTAEYVAAQGGPEGLIVKIAEDKIADLIVMGTHARRGLGHAFLGRVAERVVRIASGPVLTVPPPA